MARVTESTTAPASNGRPARDGSHWLWTCLQPHRTRFALITGMTLEDRWCDWQFADKVVFAPGHALITMAWMVFLMARLDPWLTLFVVAVAPFTVSAAFLIGKPLHLAAQFSLQFGE